MRIEELLNAHFDQFSENEKHVCRYLANHYTECAQKSLEEFANCCNVSKTLLVRFAKKLGLSGYSELKARIKLERKESVRSTQGLLADVTDSYHKMMDDLLKKNLTPLFEKLYGANRVFIYAAGDSQRSVAGEMKRIFLPAKEMIPLQGPDMGEVLCRIGTPEDLVFMISLSGESEEAVRLAEALKVKAVPAVSITRLQNNTLASLCGENLYISSIRLPISFQLQYEIATPYFILIEFLFLSYQDYLFRRQ